jgi:hypothetical protein
VGPDADGLDDRADCPRPVAIIAAMIVAGALSHWPRFWAHEGGIEYPLVLIAISLGAAIAGQWGLVT